MKTASLILAAGTQERWNTDNTIGLPKVKQLVKIGDEILIEKIQVQFPDSVVVTKTAEIQKHSQKWFNPKHCNITIATLFSTKDLWQDWNTILLGDVLYGNKTIESIKTQEEPIMFYGDKGEIYAFKFTMPWAFPVIQSIHAIATSKDFKSKYGKLWNLYRQLNGRDFRKEYIGKFFTFVTDCMDFDNKKQYLKYAKNKALRT